MKVGLFVEGSFGVPHRGREPFAHLWQSVVPAVLDLREIDVVVPISKKTLLAMDPEVPRSGGAVPLDELIRQVITSKGIEAAVVVWDLIPRWAPDAQTCRWNETLELYRLMADRGNLPPEWLHRVRAKYQELVGRVHPKARAQPPQLQSGAILAVCMEPMFESLLVQEETAIRAALNVTGKNVPDWPAWDVASHNPDIALLGPALSQSRSVSKAPIFRGT